MATCNECRYNIDGYCHALPPEEQKAQLHTEWEHDEEYMKYPQIIPEAIGCIHFKN